MPHAPLRAVPLSLSRSRDREVGPCRYRAELREIEARYTEWEIRGPAEIRDVDSDARAFSPHRQTINNLAPVLDVAECAGAIQGACPFWA